MDHYVHRTPRVGTSVLISESWYKFCVSISIPLAPRVFTAPNTVQHRCYLKLTRFGGAMQAFTGGSSDAQIAPALFS